MKIVSLLLVSLLVSGCAGLGFNKQCTLMPDNVKVEVKLNPQDNYIAKELVGGVSWNLK